MSNCSIYNWFLFYFYCSWI